jgi:hypothetical protein
MSCNEAMDAKREISDLRRRIKKLELAMERLRDHTATNEFQHAVGHALACDQGTTFCPDCDRLLRGAITYSEKVMDDNE